MSYERIRMKIEENEIEVVGERQDIPQLLELALKAFKDTLGELKGPQKAQQAGQALQQPSQSAGEPVQLPPITPDPNASLPVNLIKMFQTEWGKKPRKLSEVKEALDSFGLVYPKQTVAVTLLRLAKEGKIRRFKNEEGEYVYIATPAIMQALSGGNAP